MITHRFLIALFSTALLIQISLLPTRLSHASSTTSSHPEPTPVIFAGSSTLLTIVEQLTPFLESPISSSSLSDSTSTDSHTATLAPHTITHTTPDTNTQLTSGSRYRIAVQGGGSSMGVKSVRLGMSDIGMISRALTEQERQRYHSYSLAYDMVVLIVHRDNPLENLDTSQVANIFTGKQSTWPQSERPINVISKEHGRATRVVFDKAFDLRGKLSKRALFIGANGQAILTVGRDPNAIAYVAYSAAKSAIEIDDAAIKILRLNNRSPNPNQINIANYPLVRQLNFIWRAESERKIAPLMEQFGQPHIRTRLATLHLIPAQQAYQSQR